MRLDFGPILLALVLAFVVLGTAQLVRTLPGGEHGILRFEEACPIYHTTGNRVS
jgi:hypothetical protein